MKNRISASIPAALWTLLLVGCGGQPGDASRMVEWAGTVADSAGVTLVANPDEGIWGEDDRWTVTEEIRIGTTGGDPEYQFSQISGIAGLEDGRIAIFDQQGQHFRIFGPDGTHLRTVGRPGSGPGEFAVGGGPLLVIPGDTIIVPDVTNQRVNRYDSQGTPIDSYPLDFSTGLPMAWAVRDDGLIANQLRPLNLPGTEEADPNDRIVIRTSDGTVVDTVLVLGSGGSFQITAQGVPQRTVFAAEPLWTLSGDRVVYGVTNDYRVFQYGPDGVLRLVFMKPFENRLVSEGDQQMLRDAIDGFLEEFGLSPQQREASQQALGFAETYPAFGLVRGGPEGTIWVQHIRTPDQMTEEELESFNLQLGFGSTVWDVFDAEGRFLGPLDMPAGFQPLSFEGDRILGIWRDELDVQFGMVLRIDRP
jgi:hypothetical protein